MKKFSFYRFATCNVLSECTFSRLISKMAYDRITKE